MTHQLRLPSLHVHANCQLVDAGAARTVLGVDAETLASLVESGALPWAWDFSTGPRRRELRLWRACLDASRADEVRRWPVDRVLAEVLGTRRETFRAAELEIRFTISAQLVKALHERGEWRGEIVGHTRHITRESLGAWLRRRAC